MIIAIKPSVYSFQVLSFTSLFVSHVLEHFIIVDDDEISFVISHCICCIFILFNKIVLNKNI